MKWDELSPEEKKAVCMVALEGQKPSAQNYNRVHDQLANNPRLADRYIQEAGIADQASVEEIDDDVGEEEHAASEIEEAVSQAADDSEMQEDNDILSAAQTQSEEAYDNPNNITDVEKLGLIPVIPGESADEYVARMAKLKGRTAPQMPGRRVVTDTDI